MMPTLADKITSLEEYKTVIVPAVSRTRPFLRELTHDNNDLNVTPPMMSVTGMLMLVKQPVGTGVFQVAAQSRIPASMWWFHRERARLAYGVYRQTSVLSTLMSHSQFAAMVPHVSNEDKTMIAFTATPDDGMKDRQTRMALGRFLRKYIVNATDDVIAYIEASHRTELDPPVSFIVAEDEPQKFLDAYCAVNSCMGKSIAHFEYANKAKMHPVYGYCTPGFQLAILKNASGGISARSLVWINPKDPEDKRMVRTYGDTVLDTYLRTNGFKMLSFEGAYLKTKVVPGTQKTAGGVTVATCVTPYVDGYNAPDAELNGRGVWDGGERIYLLKNGSKLKVPAQYIGSVQSASGSASFKAFPIERVSVISGKTFNAFVDTGGVDVWYQGAIGFALASEVTDWATSTNYDEEGNATSIKIEPGTKTFRHGMTDFVDNDLVRRCLGYIKLDPLYGKDEWFNRHSASEPLVTDQISGTYIKRADAVQLIGQTLRIQLTHQDHLPEDAVRVASHNDIKTWATAQTRLVSTSANRKVIPGIHEVVQGWDGKWYYSKTMKAVSLLSDTIYIPKDKELADMKIGLPPSAVDHISSAVDSINSDINRAKKKALFAVFGRQGDMLCPIREVKGGGLEAGYIFEYMDIPLKLVEPWIMGKFEDTPIKGMKSERAIALHSFGKLVLKQVDELWAAKPQPKATDVAATEAA